MDIIKLQAYRKPKSKMYSGRDHGIEVRNKLKLDEKDRDEKKYTIYIPNDTLAINSSFFGGLFSDSVIFLGKEKFKEKYNFLGENGETLKKTLVNDIEEGIYDAINS